MRQLKDIRTATAKRDKIKRAAEKKPAFKKPVAKSRPKKIEADHQKQKEQVSRSFAAGREIIADASERAKKLLNQAVKDQAAARELEIDLGKQLKESKELQTRVEAIAQGQEESKKNLDVRQEGIFTTEQAIARMSDETASFRQNSIDLLQDVIALINLTAERIAEVHKRDETRQQLSENISATLGKIGERLQSKEEHLARKDKELQGISAMLEDGRTSLNMAEKEIRNRSK